MIPAQTMFNLELVYKEETAVLVLGARGQESGEVQEGGKEFEGEDSSNKAFGKTAEIANISSGNEVLNKLRSLETDIETIKIVSDLKKIVK